MANHPFSGVYFEQPPAPLPRPITREELRARQVASEYKNETPPLRGRIELSPRERQQYSVGRLLGACWARSPENYFERELTLEAWKMEGRPGTPGLDTGIIPFEVRDLVVATYGQRDQTVASASGGGYLVGTTVPFAADAQRPAGVARRAGARFLSGLRGNITIAKQTGGASVTWASTEVTPATEGTPTWGQVSLTPKTALAYIEMSRMLTLQSDIAEAAVRRDLVRICETELDKVALNGSGSSGQPTGILQAGIGTFTGASIAWSGILEAQTDILGANASPNGSVAFVCQPAVASLLAARQGFSTNAPIWQGPLAEGTIAGCPAFTSMMVPANTLLAGDFSQVVIGEWGAGLEVQVSQVADFQRGIIGVRATYSVDVGVLFATAFSVATSVS